MSERPRCLVLSNSRSHAEHVLLLCEMAGYTPYLATNRPDVQPDSARLTIRLESLRREDPGRTVADLNETSRVHGVTMLVPADTAFTLWLIENHVHLATRCFPKAKIEAFRTLRNKASFARLVQSLGIEHPPTTTVRQVNRAGSVQIECPVMIKPTMREGGFLVVKEDDQAMVESGVRHALKENGGPVVVQQFVAGRDIDLSLLAHDGEVLQHTIQWWGEDGLVFGEHPGVLEIGRRICEHLKLTGLVHFDMRVERETDRVVVIEANPRVWASITESLRAGVNFIEAGLRLAE